MQFSAIPRIGILFSAALLVNAQQKPGLVVSTGVPPRAAATEYPAQAHVGTTTIAADFVGHSVPTPDATFTTEQYVIVEAAFYGKDGDRVTLSPDQFSLKINGKKTLLEGQPYAVIFNSLKDPEWEESQAAETAEKSKTSVSGSGGGGGLGANDPKPLPPKMPIGLRRAMEQKVTKAAMPEGDRPIPLAGLLFFQYGGNVKKIQSIELYYNGTAGKAKLDLLR
jgi:hypothetical protein